MGCFLFIFLFIDDLSNLLPVTEIVNSRQVMFIICKPFSLFSKIKCLYKVSSFAFFKCLYNLIDTQKLNNKHNTSLFHHLQVSFTGKNYVIFSLSQHVSVF